MNSIRKITAQMKSNALSAASTAKSMVRSFHQQAVCGNAGEGYIDTAVKILISVVLGALLLAGLYALFNDTVMPTLVTRIEGMFNYTPS